MAFEVGSIVDGKVTGITNFGAFIELSNGKTGLCHISEIADEYVKSVKDHLHVNKEVKVKIIGLDGKGKMNLSIKKSVERKNEDAKPQNDDLTSRRPQRSAKPAFKKNERSNFKNEKSNYKSSNRPSESKYSNNVYTQDRPSRGSGFEDLLSDFIKDSDSKQRFLKKNMKSTRRGNGFNGKR